MFKKISALVLCLLIMLSVVGCGETPGSSTPSDSSSESSQVEEIHYPINLLTGQEGLSEEAVGKRPVAIMINNIKAALPQYGIAQADIIFETLVEGGITRMMAIYGDYTKIPNVCTIRSARFYYPLVASSFDAIYVHWGEETKYATQTIAEIGIDRLSGASNPYGLFDRDQSRRQAGYAYEHTGYFKGPEVPDALAKLKYRTDLKEGYDDAFFSFAETDVTPTSGQTHKVQIDFSKAYYSTFTYDEATGTYLKQHCGKPHMDGKAGTQLGFTNLLILETEIDNLTNVLMDVDVVGSGEGWWVSNGAYQQIRWSKATKTSEFTFTDLSGNELTVNTGKSYIAMTKPNTTTITELAEETLPADPLPETPAK